MSKNKTLGALLSESRKKAKLSQRDVALKLNYTTPQFISNWERGISHPPLKDLKLIAKIYNVSAEELFEVMLGEVVAQTELTLRHKFSKSR